MKKALSVILSLCMILTTVALDFTATAADVVASGNCGDSGNSVTWTLTTDGVLTLSGSGQRMAEYTATDHPAWYGYKDQIRSLVVENGVINVGAFAFYDCTELKSVSLGTIDTIGNNAFQNCTSLLQAQLPASCVWVWSGAFRGCTSLLNANLESCSSYSGCVPDEMFSGCTSLSVVKLGNSITKFNKYSFQNCTSLKAIITNASSLSIANNNAFSNVRKADVCIVTTSSGAQSFASSNGFATSSVTAGYCSDNTYNARKLGWSFDFDSHTLSFNGSGDMNYYENGSQPWYRFIGAVNTVSFANTDGRCSTSTTAFDGATAIMHLDLTNVYSVGWACFRNCTNISGNVRFDGTIEQIWGYAFENNSSIDSVTFGECRGDHDLQIKGGAFKGCGGTTYWLDIPQYTTVIEEEAFFDTNFNYVKIFSENITIGNNAFGDGNGGYSRFFGLPNKDTGVYNFVTAHRAQYGYNWHYYCSENNALHTYVTDTIQPTCTADGYDLYHCRYCDADSVRSDFVPALGHKYSVTSEADNEFIYTCSRCAATGVRAAAVDVLAMLNDCLSLTAGDTSYIQYNYNGKCDINGDGVINARDYLMTLDKVRNFNVTNKTTTIDTNTKYQTVEGFGASACWWSQYVGTWENADDIIKLLYDNEEGIGLNIYRYNLGAGSRDINDTSMYIDDERTNCFLMSNGRYNWNNDAGAMNALAIAQAHNPDLKVTLFCNSPPVYMTVNGKAYCPPVNWDGTYNPNISRNNYQRFADFVATCAEHFIDEGYNVTTVSPINEPEWAWAAWRNGDGTLSMNQEGCNWESDAALRFYNDYMIPTLRSNPKLNGKVSLSVWESGQLDHGVYWNDFLPKMFSSAEPYASSNANIRSYVDSLDTHSYWANTESRQRVAQQLKSAEYGQKVRCTEYCQMGTDGSSGVYGRINKYGMTNGLGIEYGLAMADIIHQDMTILDATEWDWWVGCGKGIYTDSLVYVNGDNHSDIQTAKRLYCLGNYSRFIQEGATRVKVDTGSAFGADLTTAQTYSWTDDWGTYTDKNNYIEQSAYLNPDGTVAIVYINNSDTNEFTAFDASKYDHFVTYVTDETRDLAKVQEAFVGEQPVMIPANSVTTVMLYTGTVPAKSTDGAYLFAYFVGNDKSEQTIHLAISDDGYDYMPLNNNEYVVRQKLGTKCCRDPYIFKGNDDYYYIIATDMDASENIWWGNSSTMVIWRSKNLVNWSSETIIDMKAILPNNDINRCWAPQVIWDDKEQKYMVYFALAAWPYTGNRTHMYYCYTDDLMNQSHYSQPQLLYKPRDERDAIDGDIIYDAKNKLYYLYYKDESKATICYVTSSNLTGPYKDDANPRKVVNCDVGLEGCNSFFITGTDTLVMFADAYGDGYFVVNQTTDFKHFNTLNKNDYCLSDCSPRHGSVIPITTDQRNVLLSSLT